MNVTVIGAAKSGIAAAKLAKQKGYNVFLTESNSVDKYSEAELLLKEFMIDFEFGNNSDKGLKDCDLIVASPGVPPSAEIIKKAETLKIQMISEVEFASRYLKNPIIGITGTNGKTTTTALTTFIFNNSGKKAVAAGNIGTPLSSLVDNIDEETVIVAELSSYQLDRCNSFRPDVAILLNISPDHLCYHGTMEKYIQAKFKISCQQNAKNLLILNGEDSVISEIVSQTKARIDYFGFSPLDRGIYVENGVIKFALGQHKTEELMLVSELSLPGIHNTQNSMAAALAARAFEISNENIRKSLMKFEGVEHRLEFVRTIDGIDYINDSKATNINATWYALSSYSRPIIWLAGGRGDNNDYSLLDELVAKNVKAIVAIGEEKDAIFDHYCLMKRCIKSDTLELAIQEAKDIAEAGDVVLFTPACKSFDMFSNFEHRGDCFKQIVISHK